MNSAEYKRIRFGRRRRNRSHKSERPVICSRDEKIIILRQWMKHKAGFTNTLCPAVFSDTGRGLMSRRRIQAGETIVSLPYSILITSDTVFRSQIGKIIRRWEPKLIPQHCLSLFLIWEKHKQMKSTWFPYIDSVPATFTTPLYFTSLELSLLPENIRVKADTMVSKVKDLYKNTQSFTRLHWPEFYDILTYEVFIWAWSVVNTRSVYLDIGDREFLCNDEPNNMALAPFLDLLNHTPSADIKAWLNPATDSYEILTHDAYKPYQQVFISYGCHGNQKLFLDYGFCVPTNPHDEIEISYDAIMKACSNWKIKHTDKKLCLLRENDLLGCFKCSMEGISWKLWAVLKTMVMDWTQLQQWSRIFSCEETTSVQTGDELSRQASKLASYILKEYQFENKRKIASLVQREKELSNTDHLQLIKHLLQIEADIIRASMPT